jgi:hypothetical protein
MGKWLLAMVVASATSSRPFDTQRADDHRQHDHA